MQFIFILITEFHSITLLSFPFVSFSLSLPFRWPLSDVFLSFSLSLSLNLNIYTFLSSLNPIPSCTHSIVLIKPGINVTLRRITAAELKEVHRILIWGTPLENIEAYFRVRPDAFYGAFFTDKPQQIVGE